MATVFATATLGAASKGSLVTETGTKGTYKFTVDFVPPVAFTTEPVVIVTSLQGTNYAGKNIADTFAISVTSVTTKNFVVNVNRVDNSNGTWDQDLRLQYAASTPG